ncbi:MAG: sugar ABC transporter permease, partial [Planctomycetota bacterium]
ARVEERAGYLLVSPWVIGFVAFMAFPIGLSLILAFSKWSGISTLEYAQWVGLGNFRELFGYDEQFAMSIRVTAYYALFAVPGGQILALIAALLMAQPVKFSGFFRSAWYLPSVLAGVGVAILWRWVFDGEFGLMNQYIVGPMLRVANGAAAMFGVPLDLQPPEWFVDDAAWFGPPAFAIMSYWAIGGTMVIYLAGLKGIPAELYEAAAIDGASSWRRFLHVTLPMLSPIIFFNFIMAIIGSFQVFTQAYVMTGGGPGDSTRFYVLYLFNRAFEQHDMGYASAMAWILLVIILTLTLLVMRGTRRFVYYEALK